MNCLEFAKQISLECAPIKTNFGEDALFVSLSTTFVDGSPLTMYVIPSGQRILLTDGGDTLAHLQKIGFRILGDRRRWTSLRDAISHLGAAISQSGEIEFWTGPDTFSQGVSKFNAAMIAAACWEQDHFRQPLDGTMLFEEVKEYLLQLRPHATVIERRMITGISGREYSFPISLDGVLIDAMSAAPASSAAMIRRLVDIRAIRNNKDVEIEIAVDDRQNQKRIAQDIKVVELFATPLKVSDLQIAWQKSIAPHVH